MKKILSILGIIILSLSLVVLAAYVLLNALSSAPDRITESWQTITIGGLGAFRIPAEWNVEDDDGILFITDRPRAEGDYEIYIVAAILGMDSQLHEVFDGAERGDLLRSIGFSNGGTVRVFDDRINGIPQERRVISFNNFGGGMRHDYWMYIVNCEVVDQWHAEQIARTYRSNRDDFDNPNVGRLIPPPVIP